MKKNKIFNENLLDESQYVYLKYNIESSCDIDEEEPTNYITEINGGIYLNNLGKTDKETKIGEFNLSLLDMVSVLNKNLSFSDMLDGHGIDMSGYAEDFFNFDTNTIKNTLLGFPKDEDMQVMVNVLIINHIILNKEYMGNGLGAKVIKNIEHIFGQEKLIVLIPFPLQYGGYSKEKLSMFNLESLTTDEKKLKQITSKLTKTYNSIGYKKEKGLDIVYKNLSEA